MSGSQYKDKDVRNRRRYDTDRANIGPRRHFQMDQDGRRSGIIQDNSNLSFLCAIIKYLRK